MDLQTAERTLRIRHINRWMWWCLGIAIGKCVLVVALMVAGALLPHGGALFFTGLVLSLLLLPLTALLCTVFRPVLVDAQSVRLPRGFKSQTIKTSEVAGVGLLYQWTDGGPVPEEWVLEVWDVHGQSYRVGPVFLVSHRRPAPLGEKPRRVQFLSTRPEDWPMPNEDAEALAQSRPGQIAASIYNFILAVQGEDGPLARLALQKKPEIQSRWAVTKTLAWWSPDGEMGRASVS